MFAGKVTSYEPYFVQTKRSKYGQRLYSTRHSSQSGILEATGASDISDALGGTENLDSLVDVPTEEPNILYPLNPCHLDGVYFTRIQLHAHHGE